ncbi:MAG: type ISP restriction/modification enzyme, partial [Gammaproteobacteria bacterium]
AFVPQDRAGRRAIVRLDDVFVKFGAGIKTNRDAVAIAFSKAELLRAVEAYSPSLASCAHVDGCVQTILYRPFDERVIFYHETVVASRSLPTMQHVLVGANLGLIASSTWTTPERFSVNVSRSMVEMKTGTHDRGTTYFPLYRYEKILGAPATRVDNLKPEFLERWGRITQMPLTADGNESQSRTSGPEDVLHWLYAICHSCEYRLRHRALLAQGFPIVLFPRQPELLQDIARLGGELVAVHLMDSPQLDRPITTYTGPKNPEVGRVGWSDDTVWLDAAATRRGQSATPGTMGFRGVPEAVWNFHIGGYQVCEKWLKDRKGRTLTNDDLAHYRKIVVALAETIRLMQEEIDEVIERYGGWPGASRRATPRP